jgi:hypothetical protein
LDAPFIVLVNIEQLRRNLPRACRRVALFNARDPIQHLKIRIDAVKRSDATAAEQRCERRLKKNSFAASSAGSENIVLLQSLESSKFTDCSCQSGRKSAKFAHLIIS